MITNSSTHLFFFNDTATTEIYTLSLHDALPISRPQRSGIVKLNEPALAGHPRTDHPECKPVHRCPSGRDRKSTRLNSSHSQISYAVFCLKKKHTTHSAAELWLMIYGASARSCAT